jgi:hypothetical protein
MKIQYFNGGLGNQLFQYIFYRYHQLHASDQIWLDDMKFFRVHEHNGYELERIFGLKPNLISQYFDSDVWEHMVEVAEGGGNLCQQLKDIGMDIIMIAETTNYIFDGQVYRVNANEYHPDIVNLPGNIYYFGYWINYEWFSAIRETMMQELVFPAITDKVNLEYESIIKANTSVSVHIRRGDFVTLDWTLPEEFYYSAMQKVAETLPNATYLVFSDDIDWCKDNYRELGFDVAGDRLVFVTGNEGERSYVDIDLMSRCQGMIIANSAFSYFAALLNNHPDKFVINPVSYRKV